MKSVAVLPILVGNKVFKADSWTYVNLNVNACMDGSEVG